MLMNTDMADRTPLPSPPFALFPCSIDITAKQVLGTRSKVAGTYSMVQERESEAT